MIGQKLHHFRIIEQIGKGGMGVVYRAHDEQLDRDVAIKMLNAGIFSDETVRKQFRKEALTLSKLNHPNIETVHEFNTQDGIDYLVIEYIPGWTLADKLADGPLPEQEILALAIQLTEGLKAAHDQNILHRDLKPNNLRITPDGRLKILDFGLAKLLPPVSELATTESVPDSGSVAGTLPYVSPEQLRSEPLDSRSDLYSAGVVLYEMSTGRRPFPQNQVPLLIDAILHQDPQAPRTFNSKLSESLEEVILKALEKDRDKRYVSARELQKDLQKLGTASLPSIRLPKSTKTFSFQIALTLILFLVIASAIWFATRSRNPLPSVKYIVVLPFTNIGQTAANQAFCDGLVETLTSKLTQIKQFHPSLWVVPAIEVRQQGVNSITDARKAFGITLAITGSLQREADRLRLTANLVDAKTLRQLQATTIEAHVDDPLLQQGLVQQIANLMELQLNSEAQNVLKGGQTRNARAYDFYLQGQGYLARYEKPENLDAAITSFEQATTLDPDFVLASTGLAQAYWQKYDQSKDPRWIDLAYRNSKHAADLNPGLAPVLVMHGVIQAGTGKYAEAISQFERALKIDPVSFEAYIGIAKAYAAMGETGKAESTYRKAIDLQPDVWIGYRWLGQFYYMTADYDQAAQMYEKIIQLVPDSFLGYYKLGGIYILQGEFPKAISVLEKSISIRPNHHAYWNLGYTHYLLRRFSEAAVMYERGAQLRQPEHWIWGHLGDAYFYSPHQRQKAPSAYERAISFAQKELAVNPQNADALVSIAYYQAKLDKQRESLESLQQALALAPDNAEFAFLAGLVYNHFHQTSTALEWLQRAVNRGYSRAEIKNRIEFDSLHDDARFRALLQQPKTKKGE